MELQESSKKKVASTSLFKEPENQSRVCSTTIYWHYYDSPEENKCMDSKNISKILQQRNCYPENVTGSEGPEIDLIHFIPSILLHHLKGDCTS